MVLLRSLGFRVYFFLRCRVFDDRLSPLASFFPRGSRIFLRSPPVISSSLLLCFELFPCNGPHSSYPHPRRDPPFLLKPPKRRQLSSMRAFDPPPTTRLAAFHPLWKEETSTPFSAPPLRLLQLRCPLFLNRVRHSGSFLGFPALIHSPGRFLPRLAAPLRGYGLPCLLSSLSVECLSTFPGVALVNLPIAFCAPGFPRALSHSPPNPLNSPEVFRAKCTVSPNSCTGFFSLFESLRMIGTIDLEPNFL